MVLPFTAEQTFPEKNHSAADLPPASAFSSVIHRSWQRCRAAGLSPALPGLLCAAEPDLRRRLRENAALLPTVVAHLQQLSASLAGIRHVLCLVNQEGIMLYAAGNPPDRDLAARFLPGCDLSEGSAGTNAAGTALAENLPVMVAGAEHYCAGWQDLAALAAPVHGENGRVIGAILLATYLADGKRERLELVAHAAWSITREWARSTPVPPGGKPDLLPVQLRQAEAALATAKTHLAAQAAENMRLHGKLREADRRRDEFLAMLAHELRNPLAPILNAVQMLGLCNPAGPDVQRARDVIERQVQHMARLLEDLLEVSRITCGKITLRQERVDLASVVEQALQTSRPLLRERRHALSVSLPPEPIVFVADPVRLAQILVNLLNNAAKYTAVGGQIWLIAAQEGPEVVLRVRDTGIGIPADVLPHIFDLFVQADRSLAHSQGGLGVGLTLVRRLVEMHGGSVTASSAGSGQGSEFVVRLPALTAAPAPAERPAPRACAPESRRHILLVDDNRDAAEMLADVLEMWGYRVSLAHDGPAALEAAAADLPDAVILDIGLPGIDGHTVARHLRARSELAQIPLFALSGYGEEEERQQSRAAGFDRYLTKPVDLRELERLLSSQLHRVTTDSS